MKLKVPERLVKPLDYLFIFRPTLFFPVWIITLAGYSAFFTSKNETLWWVTNFNLKVVLNLLFVTVLSGAVFIFNQLKDINTDKINKKLFLVSEQYVNPETASKIAIISLIISYIYFIITFQFIALVILILFGALWGYFYNFEPFRLKDRPILGFFANIGGSLLLFVAGWSTAGALNFDTLLFSVPYVFALSSVTLLTMLPDYNGDAISGKNTFPVKYGKSITIYLSVIFVFLALIFGIYVDDPVISLPSLLSIPLFVILLFKNNLPSIFRCIRYPILFLGLTLCVQFPYFFILLALNYYLSRIYYTSRFNLDYPTFKVD